jgi:hypothetical protein
MCQSRLDHDAAVGSRPSLILAETTLPAPRLSNRIDAEAQRKILGSVHTVTIEEIRALQLENANADERVWSQLHEITRALRRIKPRCGSISIAPTAARSHDADWARSKPAAVNPNFGVDPHVLKLRLL